MEENTNIKERMLKQKFNLQNPIFFGFLITGCLFLIFLIAVILATFFNINLPSISIPIVYTIITLLFAIIYKKKYTQDLSQVIAIKTSFSSSVFLLIFFCIAAIVHLIIRKYSFSSFLIITGVIVSTFNFLIVYLSLNICKLIPLHQIKIFSNKNEDIILEAETKSIKLIFFYIIICIIILLYQFIIKGILFTRGNVAMDIVSYTIIMLIFIESIDMFFFSKLILTNNRIIIRHHLRYKEIALNDIASLDVKQICDFGNIIIYTTNGNKIRSITVKNPNTLKNAIEKNRKK